MSIADEITALRTNVTALKNAIISKHGTVSGDKGLAGLVEDMASITPYVPLTGIEITSPTAQDFYVGQPDILLQANLIPTDATHNGVLWSVSNSHITIVENAGQKYAHANSNGSATITAKTEYGNYTDTVTLEVKTAVTGVSVSPASFSIEPEATKQLTATITPSTATDKTGVWSSSDNTIATVNTNGLVTGISEGDVTITFTTNDGGFTATSSASIKEMPKTWAKIQEIVENGEASDWYSPGDEITIDKWTDPSSGTQYDMTWVVVDMNNAYVEGKTESQPAMTLMCKYALPEGKAFSHIVEEIATEATAQEGLYYYGYSGSTYTMLNLNTGDSIPYSSYTKVSKCKMPLGSEYTNIVTKSYTVFPWEHSYLRQWLNSDGAANSWFTPFVGQGTPVYATQGGFLSGFTNDFKNALTATKVTSSQFVGKNPASVETYDKVFLPGPHQLGYTGTPILESKWQHTFVPYHKLEDHTGIRNMVWVRYFTSSSGTSYSWNTWGSYMLGQDTLNVQNTATRAYTGTAYWLAPAIRITAKPQPAPEYTYLQYLESDGVAYANAGKILNQSSRPEIRFKPVFPTDSSTYGVFGCNDGASYTQGAGAVGLTFDKDEVRPTFRCSAGTTWCYNKFSDGLAHTIKIVNHSSRPAYDAGYTVDGVECSSTLGYVTGSFSHSKDDYLFAYNQNGTVYKSTAGTRVEFIKVYNNSNTLLYNFLPCRKANGELGFHETVNDVFYGNVAGSGAFIAGPEVSNG